MRKHRGNSSPKNPTPIKKPSRPGKIAQKVEFEITEDDLDKVTGGRPNAPIIKTAERQACN
jgi:hypothetical protein